MTPTWAALGMVFGMALASTAAAADPITIVSDQRFTSASVSVTDASGASRQNNADRQSDTLMTTAAASTELSVGTASGTLKSTFSDPMHWSGSGTADASWAVADSADISAMSTFNVTFLVTSPTLYQFNGNFTSSFSNLPGLPFQGGGSAQTGASLFSRTPPPDDPEHPSVVFGGRGPFSGLLAPDQYFFSVLASGSVVTGRGGSTGDSHAAFDLTFDLTPTGSSPSPTPEPASLLLLGTGIAAMFRVRCRNRIAQA
jgi:hypothetical protein